MSELLLCWEVGFPHGQFRVVKEQLLPDGVTLGSIEHLLRQVSLQLANLGLGKGLLALRWGTLCVMLVFSFPVFP